MTKAAIKRAESQTCLSYPEREQARPKVNDELASFPLFLLFLWDFIILKLIEILLSHGNNRNNGNFCFAPFCHFCYFCGTLLYSS